MPTSNGEGQIFNFSELERLTPTIYSYLTPYTAILCGIVLGCWVGIAQKAKNCSYEFWELPLNGAIWALIGVVGVSLVFSIFAVIIHMFIMAAVFIIIVICVIFMGIGSLRDYKNQK